MYRSFRRVGVLLVALLCTLALVRTPAKATAKISCKGRKCPKGARVTVTRPGYIGQYTTIKIRSDQRRYIRRDRCIVPGMSKPTACPEDS